MSPVIGPTSQAPPPALPSGDRFAPSRPPAVVGPAQPTAGAVDRVELSIDQQPPPEVKEAVAVAHQRALDLASQQRELHFFQDAESNRIVVQVRDLDGKVIRTVPSEHAFDVLAGAAL